MAKKSIAKIKYNKPVVDACIASQASTRQGVSNSKSLAAVTTLESLKINSITILMTEILMDEWCRHTTVYSAAWLASMERKGLVFSYDLGKRYSALNSKIDKLRETSSFKKKIKKDTHLICAAIFQDGIIISDNHKDARSFKKYQDLDKGIGGINWFIPDRHTEAEIETWISKGLPKKSELRIKNQTF